MRIFAVGLRARRKPEIGEFCSCGLFTVPGVKMPLAGKRIFGRAIIRTAMLRSDNSSRVVYTICPANGTLEARIIIGPDRLFFWSPYSKGSF
jgi:hypothetical protein